MYRKTLLATAFLIATLVAPAIAQRASTPPAQGVLCTLCLSEGCQCSNAGDACVACPQDLSSGTLTPATNEKDRETTRKVCEQVDGTFSQAKCNMN